MTMMARRKRKLPADLAEAEGLIHSAASGANTIRESYKALQSVDLRQVYGIPTAEQLSEDDIATWLVARYGVKDVSRLCTALSGLPSTLASSQKIRYFKVGTICVCGWSANLESKLLAVFCSLRRLLLGTLLF